MLWLKNRLSKCVRLCLFLKECIIRWILHLPIDVWQASHHHPKWVPIIHSRSKFNNSASFPSAAFKNFIFPFRLQRSLGLVQKRLLRRYSILIKPNFDSWMWFWHQYMKKKPDEKKLFYTLRCVSVCVVYIFFFVRSSGQEKVRSTKTRAESLLREVPEGNR